MGGFGEGLMKRLVLGIFPTPNEHQLTSDEMSNLVYSYLDA